MILNNDSYSYIIDGFMFTGITDFLYTENMQSDIIPWLKHVGFLLRNR